MVTIQCLFEIRRWSHLETQINRRNSDPIEIANAFDKKSNQMHNMIPSTKKWTDKEQKFLKHDTLFKDRAVKMTKRGLKKIIRSEEKRRPYIGPERRKANIPRLKKVA